MTAVAVLAWIDQHCRQVIIQNIPEGRRRKNRVILSYMPAGANEVEVVGARDLSAAVHRAQARIDATSGKENAA